MIDLSGAGVVSCLTQTFCVKMLAASSLTQILQGPKWSDGLDARMFSAPPDVSSLYVLAHSQQWPDDQILSTPTFNSSEDSKSLWYIEMSPRRKMKNLVKIYGRGIRELRDIFGKDETEEGELVSTNPDVLHGHGFSPYGVYHEGELPFRAIST